MFGMVLSYYILKILLADIKSIDSTYQAISIKPTILMQNNISDIQHFNLDIREMIRYDVHSDISEKLSAKLNAKEVER